MNATRNHNIHVRIGTIYSLHCQVADPYPFLYPQTTADELPGTYVIKSPNGDDVICFFDDDDPNEGQSKSNRNSIDFRHRRKVDTSAIEYIELSDDPEDAPSPITMYAKFLRKMTLFEN
jgi:hypothetical protein